MYETNVYETIEYTEGADNVATLTLNRPSSMNSFNAVMLDEVSDVWARVRKNNDVHAVVIRGAEGRAFCTGKDIKEKNSPWHEDVIWSQWDPGQKLGPKQNKVWKPIITAVHGLCCGGAYYFVNESDIVICSDDAAFFDPHVSYGKVSSVEPIGLTRRIPYGEVMRMNLLGNHEHITADTALRISLVTEVLNSHERLWQRAQDLASIIALQPTIATQGTVKAIWESLDVNYTTAIERAVQYIQVGKAEKETVDLSKTKPKEVNKR